VGKYASNVNKGRKKSNLPNWRLGLGPLKIYFYEKQGNHKKIGLNYDLI